MNSTAEELVKGIYVEFISSWLEHFPRSQLLVVDYRTLTLAPWSVAEEVEQIMGLDHEIDPSKFVLNR